MNKRTSPAKPIEYCQSRNSRLQGRRDVFTDSEMPLPQQLAVWRRDAFWQDDRSLNPSRCTEPEGSIRVMMPVPKLRHEQRPKSQNLCKHFSEKCSPVLGLVPWLFFCSVELTVPRVGGRVTCDEVEKRLMPETSLGHCCWNLRES